MQPDYRRTKQLQNLLNKLGLPASAPVNWQLLDMALIHPSVSAINNYEQLEFLGDAVVRLAAAEVLRETYPDETVGEFAALRSGMVSDRTLAEFADIFGLERYLISSNSVAKDQAGRNSRLADAFEAVLGALYLSTHDMQLVRPWLDELLRQKAAQIRQDPARHNYKDALQEWTQAQYKILPKYFVQEQSNHTNAEARFIAQVWIHQQQLGQGVGRTKKAAEQAAAKQAFLAVNSSYPPIMAARGE